jgi:hypothetical protein
MEQMPKKKAKSSSRTRGKSTPRKNKKTQPHEDVNQVAARVLREFVKRHG